MSDQQNQTRCFIQAKLSDFSNRISQGYHKPVRGFFKDMLMGICGTGEPSLHNIAKFIQDDTSTKKTSERLYRNIRRDNLAEDIENILTELIRPQVTDDTLFIVDDSDIAKPYAKSMEGCGKVHNGSESKSTNGYLLMNIFALLTKTDGYSLLPASSILFAPSIELDSAKQVLQDKIVNQQIAFRSKGTYVFDRGYDDRKLIGFLVNNGVSFVIRGMGNRAIKEGIVEKNFKEEVEKMKFEYKLPGLRKDEALLCATRRIGVRTDDHPSKKSNSVEISLIVVRNFRKGSREGKDFYLLCERPLRNCSKLTRQSRDRKVIHNFRIFFTRIEGKTPIISLFRSKPNPYCPFSNPIHRIWTHLSYAGLRERIFIARLML